MYVKNADATRILEHPVPPPLDGLHVRLVEFLPLEQQGLGTLKALHRKIINFSPSRAHLKIIWKVRQSNISYWCHQLYSKSFSTKIINKNHKKNWRINSSFTYKDLLPSKRSFTLKLWNHISHRSGHWGLRCPHVWSVGRPRGRCAWGPGASWRCSRGSVGARWSTIRWSTLARGPRARRGPGSRARARRVGRSGGSRGITVTRPGTGRSRRS